MEEKSVIIKKIHPVDEILPAGQLFAFGLQHVLAMYAGAIAVPIILAKALGLTEAEQILLINADLFACGVATLIQTIGFKGVGARIPMIQGITFASVSPMVIIGQNYDIQTIYGAVIVAGAFTFLIARFFSKLIRFFPPVVTGTIITSIGMVLMPVAVNWCAGGNPKAPDYNGLNHIALAAITLIIVLLVYKYGRGFWSNVSVLIGLVVGTVIAYFMGDVSFTDVGQAAWVSMVHPLAFGMPKFALAPIISLIIVMLVVLVETTGDCIAIGEIVGKPTDSDMLASCLRADGLSTFVAAFLNSFPHTAFAQNVGLVAVTNIKSRYVVATSGLILIVLGLFPKMAAVISAIPYPVLGGAGVAMFGMIIASGIRSLSRVNFEGKGTHNLMIVAVSLGFGLFTMADPHFYSQFPEIIRIIMHSGITAASIMAVFLNIFLNGVPSGDSDQPNEESMIG